MGPCTLGLCNLFWLALGWLCGRNEANMENVVNREFRNANRAFFAHVRTITPPNYNFFNQGNSSDEEDASPLIHPSDSQEEQANNISDSTSDNTNPEEV